MARQRTAAFELGVQAAKRLEPLDAVDALGYGTDVASRFQWIRGWESEGGDITRKVVVTRRERLLECEADLSTRLQRVRDELAELDAQTPSQ